MANDKPIQLT